MSSPFVMQVRGYVVCMYIIVASNLMLSKCTGYLVRMEVNVGGEELVGVQEGFLHICWGALGV